MTKKSYDRDETGKPIKKPGWYSWRHPTRDAHDSAVARYLFGKSPRRQQRAAARRARKNLPALPEPGVER
jgi:hypothetical protein